jgi:hypothetical protein
LIVHVPPEGLNKQWQFYRDGILEIISHGGVSFIPEDVYHHLKTGRAMLYRVDFSGFFVVERCQETASGDYFLNVWLMYFLPGKGIGYKAEIIEFLDRLKAHLHCEWIDFGTTREAWVHLLDGDFKKHMVTLRRGG